MAAKSTEEKWKDLMNIADGECSCSDDQQSGEDWSICRVCEVSGFVGDIAAQIGMIHRDFKAELEIMEQSKAKESGGL